MLVAIIRIKNDNYYIELEEKDNKKYYHVVLANNTETRVLSKEEADSLIASVLDCEKSFIENRDGYDIYLDEAGNKRYFKDGKEDFVKFYENNGMPAIMTFAADNFNNETPAKSFNLKVKNAATCLLICSQIAAFTITTGFIIGENAVYAKEGIIVPSEITYEMISDYIENSEGSITEEQKEYLNNKDFINDVINIADDSRNYILKRRTKNIAVDYDYDCCETLNSNGYYNPANPNKVFLRDDSKLISDASLAHEFIHLMQDDNLYFYIKEACAEQLAYEYYNSPVQSYYDQRINVYLLTEMIGPNPIMELNFKGDTSTFEKAIYDSLEKEDADRLLELFKSAPVYDKEIKNVNKEIYDLLDKMSYNKTGTHFDDFENDYLLSVKWRNCYFNKHKAEFYESFTAAKFNENDYTIMAKEDLNNNNDIEGFRCIIHESISRDEYEKINNGNFSEYGVSFDIFPNIPAYFIKEDPDTNDRYYLINDELVAESEFDAKGYVPVNYRKTRMYFSQDIESVEKEITNQNKINVEISFKDGSRGDFSIDKGNYSQIIHHSLPVNKTIKSLSEMFPDQVSEDDLLMSNISETSNHSK